MCSIHLARALQCSFMNAAAINFFFFFNDNFQLIHFNAELHVRSRGIYTYCVCYSGQCVPSNLGQTLVFVIKQCSESDEMAVLSNPRQARLLLFCTSSDVALKYTLFHNTAAKENRLCCMLVGGHKMLARFGLVGINQLCSLKLPQSPCSQGNGGRKGKNSPRVCGHEALPCWINGGNSPSEAKTDANSGLLRSRRSRPVCISPIVSADPAVNVNAAAVRCCINATAARSKLQPPSRLQSQPHRTLHSRGHISPRPPCYGDPLLRGETMRLRRNKG